MIYLLRQVLCGERGAVELIFESHWEIEPTVLPMLCQKVGKTQLSLTSDAACNKTEQRLVQNEDLEPF